MKTAGTIFLLIGIVALLLGLFVVPDDGKNPIPPLPLLGGISMMAGAVFFRAPAIADRRIVAEQKAREEKASGTKTKNKICARKKKKKTALTIS